MGAITLKGFYRLVVDKDDLKWVVNEKKISLLLKQFHRNFCFKTPRCRKISDSSGRQNNAS